MLHAIIAIGLFLTVISAKSGPLGFLLVSGTYWVAAVHMRDWIAARASRNPVP